MRTRALILATLTLALAAPPTLASAQGKTSKAKADAKKRAMPKGVSNIQDSMDPALKSVISGPNSMMNVTKRAEKMSPAEREKLAAEWRAEQSKAFGLESADGPGAPVMSLDELGRAPKRPKLTVSSEQERRDLLLDELRTHATYDAKIERVVELVAAKEGKKSPLYARAKALRKLEARRHARSKMRIRAADLVATRDAKTAAAPNADAPADTTPDSAEASP